MTANVKLFTLNTIILAAGKGVRMRSDIPKVLHKVCGVTLLERTIRAVNNTNPNKIIVVIGAGKDLVEKEIARIKKLSWALNTNITVVWQKEQNGTGHAVQVALHEVESSATKVLILPSDSPLVTDTVFNELLAHCANDVVISLATSNPPNPYGFGRIVRNSKGDITSIVEEKDCSEIERKITETNTSIYVVNRAFLEESVNNLSNNNAQGEFYLTDIVGIAIDKNKKVTGINIKDYFITQGANSRFELSTLELIHRQRLVKHWMDEGVTFQDPATVYIEENIFIGKDSFIGANTHISNGSHIGERVHIEGNSMIINSHIKSDVIIKFSSIIEDSNVESECSIGPFARLRPGTVLDKYVKIGNFVETKKALVHSGAKINHLSYIGDAEVGQKVNIGAGTITCNYDGVNKHKTIIASNSFIGSNSCFVAPVSVGEGAYIGAGSVITKEVPPRSLGIARARQTVIDGWADKATSKSKETKKEEK